MSFLSNYCRNKLYGSLLGLDTFPKPEIFIGFSANAPVDPPGTVTEPIASDYNRISYNHWKISGRNVFNNTTVTNYTRSNWGTLRYFLLWDAIKGGNLLGYGLLSSPITATSGKVLSFSKNQLHLQIESGIITNYLVNRFLEHLFGTTTLVSTHSYIGLSYISPGDTGIIAHPTNIDYQDILFIGWNITTDSRLVNVESISFIPMSDWGTLYYLYVRDAENRVLFYAAFPTPIIADIHNPVILDPSYLTIVFD
jgi:hypothetical protein